MDEQTNENSQYVRLLNEGYTEDQIRMILQLGGLNAETGQLDKQQKQADSLRNMKGPQGMRFQSSTGGDQFVASNPLEFAATGYARYKGEKDSAGIYDKQKALQDEMMKRRLEYLKGGANPGFQQSTMPNYQYGPVPGNPVYTSPYEG